jgi:hypothetical protein
MVAHSSSPTLTPGCACTQDPFVAQVPNRIQTQELGKTCYAQETYAARAFALLVALLKHGIECLVDFLHRQVMEYGDSMTWISSERSVHGAFPQ